MQISLDKRAACYYILWCRPGWPQFLAVHGKSKRHPHRRGKTCQQRKRLRRRGNNRSSPGFFLSQARFPKRALFSSNTTSASTANGQHTFILRPRPRSISFPLSLEAKSLGVFPQHLENPPSSGPAAQRCLKEILPEAVVAFSQDPDRPVGRGWDNPGAKQEINRKSTGSLGDDWVYTRSRWKAKTEICVNVSSAAIC